MLAVRVRSFPTSPADMAALFESTIREFLNVPAERSVVTMTGVEWPILDEFNIDASNSETTGQRPPKPPETKIDAEIFRARRLSLQANPVRVNGVSINLTITAENAMFGFASDTSDGGWIALSTADNGQLDATVPLEAIEQAMLLAASGTARQKGAEIQSIQLKAVSAGEDTAFTAVITARKGFVKGTVKVSGIIAISSQLQLTISNLRCEGEGIVGTVLAGLIQPQLAKVEGGAIPLDLPLGGIRMRDVRIEPQGKHLKISALFGEATHQEG